MGHLPQPVQKQSRAICSRIKQGGGTGRQAAVQRQRVTVAGVCVRLRCPHRRGSSVLDARRVAHRHKHASVPAADARVLQPAVEGMEWGETRAQGGRKMSKGGLVEAAAEAEAAEAKAAAPGQCLQGRLACMRSLNVSVPVTARTTPNMARSARSGASPPRKRRSPMAPTNSSADCGEGGGEQEQEQERGE